MNSSDTGVSKSLLLGMLSSAKDMMNLIGLQKDMIQLKYADNVENSEPDRMLSYSLNSIGAIEEMYSDYIVNIERKIQLLNNNNINNPVFAKEEMGREKELRREWINFCEMSKAGMEKPESNLLQVCTLHQHERYINTVLHEREIYSEQEKEKLQFAKCLMLCEMNLERKDLNAKNKDNIIYTPEELVFSPKEKVILGILNNPKYTSDITPTNYDNFGLEIKTMKRIKYHKTDHKALQTIGRTFETRYECDYSIAKIKKVKFEGPERLYFGLFNIRLLMVSKKAEFPQEKLLFWLDHYFTHYFYFIEENRLLVDGILRYGGQFKHFIGNKAHQELFDLDYAHALVYYWFDDVYQLHVNTVKNAKHNLDDKKIQMFKYSHEEIVFLREVVVTKVAETFKRKNPFSTPKELEELNSLKKLLN
jgi:hypothetical protein